MLEETVSHYEVRVPGELLMEQVMSLSAGLAAAKKYNKGKDENDQARVFARYTSGFLSVDKIPRPDLDVKIRKDEVVSNG